MAMSISLLPVLQPVPAGTDIVKTLRLALDRKESLMLVPAQGRMLLIHAKAGTWADPDGLAQRLVAIVREGRCQIRRISSSSDVMVKAAANMRPIAELMWILAWYQLPTPESIERLPYRRDDVIGLTQWPNLTRLPHSPSSLRLSALFRARATSVMLAAKILKIEEFEVMRFYHCANAAGLVERVNRTTTTPEPVRHRHHGLIQSLFQRLRRTPTA